MIFVLSQRLRQVTLSLPHERLRKVLPAVAGYVGLPFGAQHAMGRLFVQHLLALDTSFGDLTPGQAAPVLDSTIDLLATTLEASIALPQGPMAARPHAERNLDDPELSLAALALRHGISLRHLHRLFAASGTTAAEWLLQRRLERCLAELAHPAQRHESITAIALRWGMSDSSTFSKAFKRRYGLTPSQYRSGVTT